jgi:nucleoid-associated protein YgaU
VALQKAVLRAIDPPNGEVVFQYNPTKYTVNKSLQWQPRDQKAADAPPLEFVKSQGRNVSMELFLDDYEDGKDVAERVAQLDAFTQVNDDNAKDAGKGRPPRVMFMWTNQHSQFIAVITSLNVTYTLFHETGKPARATVSLTLQEWPNKPEATNPTSMGSAGLRTHRVLGGETLDMIAYQELGSASRWRYIAELNHIDDPLSVEPGHYLVIAPLR